MTSIDAAPLIRRVQATRRFRVELFDGHDLAEAGWPSIEASPELRMHVYQSREFLDIWMATIGRARAVRCYLIVVRDEGGQPVLYLPLAIETKFNIRILRFMDAGIADFNAPILLAGQDLARDEFEGIWAEILSQLPAFDVIDLQKISSHVFGARNPLTYLDCTPYKSSGHAIELSVAHEDAQKTRSIVRMRKKLRRQFQRLNDIGPAEFLINPSPPRLSHVMSGLVDLKRRQYLRTTGRDFFSTPGVLDFYRKLATPGVLGRISHLSALTCDGNVVSAHLGFIGRGRFYYVLPAFDTAYRSLAAGHLLLDHLINHCNETGYATFDLGEGDFSYKQKWATHRLPLMSCEQPMTTAGLFYGQLRRARRLVAGVSA